MRRLYLVSCVSQKRPYAAPAQELYISPLFRKARAYVLKSGSPWFILSAEHGLVNPDTILAPYNKTLNTMNANDRREWSRKVRTQMETVLPEADMVVLLAGKKYREHLEPWLRSRYGIVRVPMEGLRIGKQLQWLSENEPN